MQLAEWNSKLVTVIAEDDVKFPTVEEHVEGGSLVKRNALLSFKTPIENWCSKRQCFKEELLLESTHESAGPASDSERSSQS